MFNIQRDSNTNRDRTYSNILLALSSWFIVNNLRTKTPMIDPVLAKIYFDTYSIPIGDYTENIKEAANEYEPDIIRFFLLNQYQRCKDILADAATIFNQINIVLPIQCKPFFEEMINLSMQISQHNILTKETQVLDSLRDTIILNSLEAIDTSYENRPRYDIPQPVPIKTSGKYILTDGEKQAFMMILKWIMDNQYSPMFSKLTHNKPQVYALTDMYEDSGTRFAKILDYIKTALFMICISYDDRFNCGCGWISPSLVPSVQEDMFSYIDRISAHCDFLGAYKDSIDKECSRYGGFTMAQAICLPPNTTASLACFKPEKNAISLTYKFLVCQSYINLLSYNNNDEKVIQYA